MARFVADFLPLKGTDIFDMSREMAPQLRVYLQVPPEFDESYFKYNEGGSNIERKTFFENQDKLKELLIERYRSVAQNRLHAARRNKNNGVISVYKQNIDLDNGVTMEYVSLWGREYVTLNFAEWLVRKLLEKIEKKGGRRIVILYGSNQYAHASMDDFNRVGFAAKFTKVTVKQSSWGAPSWWSAYETFGIAGGWFISTVQMKFSNNFHALFFKGEFINGVMNAANIVEHAQHMCVSNTLNSLFTQVKSNAPLAIWHGDTMQINGAGNKVYDRNGTEYSIVDGRLTITRQGNILWGEWNWFHSGTVSSPYSHETAIFFRPDDTFNDMPPGAWFQQDIGNWANSAPFFNYMEADGSRYGERVLASTGFSGKTIFTSAQVNSLDYGAAQHVSVWSETCGPGDGDASISLQLPTEFHYYNQFGFEYFHEFYYPSASVSGTLRVPKYVKSGGLDKIEFDDFPMTASTSCSPLAFENGGSSKPTQYQCSWNVSSLGATVAKAGPYSVANNIGWVQSFSVQNANPFPAYVGTKWVCEYEIAFDEGGPPYYHQQSSVTTGLQTITHTGSDTLHGVINVTGLCHCSNGKRVLQVYALSKPLQPATRYAALDGVDVTSELAGIIGSMGAFRAAFLDIKLSDLENIL